jgi:hypothetical protein
VKTAGITDLRFHDLRHTAASRLVMAGVDLYTVKEILGHKTLVMTQRYSHLSPEHQRQAVERLVPAEPVDASATDPVTAPAASATGGAGEVTPEKKWWTGGELNSRHRDFQSVWDEEQPVVPDPSPSREVAKEVYPDAGFASERQLAPIRK